MEKSLAIIKNQSIQRGLVGEIIKRIELAGLRINTIKSVIPTIKQARLHYVKDMKWIEGLGAKAKKSLKNEKKIIEIFGSMNDQIIGNQIYDWNIKQITGSEIIIIVWEGNNAVEKLKKIVGDNEPAYADLSTIRGIMSSDSYKQSNIEKRALFNVVHRSTSLKEAKREIKVWF